MVIEEIDLFDIIEHQLSNSQHTESVVGKFIPFTQSDFKTRILSDLII